MELVAHMLELATITPFGDAAYAVGGQPVLVLWGHATECQVVPEAPKFAAPRPVTPARGISPEVPSEAVADAAPPSRPLPRPRRSSRRHRRRIRKPSPRWAHRRTVAGCHGCYRCSCFAVCAAGLAALQPLPPIIVERQAPAPPPPGIRSWPNKTGKRYRRAELAELTKARDERLALCKPVRRRPAQVAPPGAEPSAANGAGAGRAARATGSHRGRSSSATAEAAPCATEGRSEGETRIATQG